MFFEQPHVHSTGLAGLFFGMIQQLCRSEEGAVGPGVARELRSKGLERRSCGGRSLQMSGKLRPLIPRALSQRVTRGFLNKCSVGTVGLGPAVLPLAHQALSVLLKGCGGRVSTAEVAQRGL
jgi:hypothetical protein